MPVNTYQIGGSIVQSSDLLVGGYSKSSLQICNWLGTDRLHLTRT